MLANAECVYRRKSGFASDQTRSSKRRSAWLTPAGQPFLAFEFVVELRNATNGQHELSLLLFLSHLPALGVFH